MAAERLKFTTELAQFIESRWPLSFYDDTIGPMPPFAVLDELLATCFFASLQREEGRDIQFNLALCDENELGSTSPFRLTKFTFVNNIFRFTTPRSFAVSELVRLAPACDPDKTLIVVHVRDDSLQVWALVDVGRESPASSVMLNDLRIRVLSPGEMEITLHGATLCVFKAGKIHEEKGGLINEGCLYECFKETSFTLCHSVKKQLGRGDWDSPVPERHVDAMAYFEALDHLIVSMRQLGHGGSIFFVPDLTFEPSKYGVTVKYACTSRQSAAWTALIGRGVIREERLAAVEAMKKAGTDPDELSGFNVQHHDVEKGLRDALDLLAHFSAVDGAVLITKRLELVGFGAVVRLDDHRYDVFRCTDRAATITERISVEEYGTRHRSAFDFCYRCPSTVAFVASQDGGMKAITRLEGAVYFWEGIRFFLSNELVPWRLKPTSSPR